MNRPKILGKIAVQNHNFCYIVCKFPKEFKLYSPVSLENEERILGWVHNSTFYWRNLYNEHPCIKELVDKNNLDHPCFVGGGYDLNSPKGGDFHASAYEDDYTLKLKKNTYEKSKKLARNTS